MPQCSLATPTGTLVVTESGGAIVDMEAAESAILTAVHAAEQMAGETIQDVIVNVSGGYPASQTVGVEVTIAGHEVGDGDLKRVLSSHFALDRRPGLAVAVVSFSYRHGLPREADLVLDVRFLKNPHYEEELRDFTGRDDPVIRFIEADPGYGPFFPGLTGLIAPLLPRFEQEGKSYLTVAVGCTGGKHRSVMVAERLTDWLRAQGQSVELRHRDLARTRAGA